MLYFLTIYFQSVLRYDALTAGLAYLVPYAVIFVTSSSGGRLATRFGVRNMLMTSLAIGALGLAMLGVSIAPHGTYLGMLPALVVYSAGMGLTFTVMFAAATTGVAGDDQAIASGIASTGQQLGNALGLAVLVAIANMGTGGLAGEPLRVATAEGLRVVAYVAAGVAIAMIAVAATLRKS